MFARSDGHNLNIYSIHCDLFYIRLHAQVAHDVESHLLERPLPFIHLGPPLKLADSLRICSRLEAISRYVTKNQGAKGIRRGELGKIPQLLHRRRKNVLGTVIPIGVPIEIGPRLKSAFHKYVTSTNAIRERVAWPTRKTVRRNGFAVSALRHRKSRNSPSANFGAQ